MEGKKSIPVIGVPIVNGVHWVKRLMLSIDYPVDNLFIINNNGRGEINEELDKLKNISNKFIKNIHITHLPSNLGVPAAWNLIIKSFLMEPYWVISNHDVAFSPGLLEEFSNMAQDKEISMIHPRAGENNVGTYDLFAITEMGVRIVGLFDENLYPAYGEDTDYIMRILNLDPKICRGLDNTYLHGKEIADCVNYEKNGQQTSKEEPQMKEKLDEVDLKNYEYLNKKWGKHWRGLYPYKFPFNNKEYSNSYTSWDLDYIRKKYLGF